MREGARAGWSVVFSLVLAGAALLACKKKSAPDPAPAPATTVSPELERAKKLLPDVKKLMTSLEEMSKKADKEPRVRKDKKFETKLEDGKYLTVGQKWLTDPRRKADADELEITETVLSICSSIAYVGEPKADDVKYMEECLGWKHIAVVRPRGLTMPKVKMETKTFDAGSFEGDMLLFDAATGDIVGRYQMNITNSDKISELENSKEDEWQDAAKKDLLENVTGVIGEQLRHEREKMGG
jgi:hypothetical protein